MDDLDLTRDDLRAYYSGDWLRTLPWPGYPRCLCGDIKCFGQKLSHKSGHVVGCICASCRGRESHSKGHKGQDRTHKALGGSGPARNDEASQKPYVVEITVMPESKEGDQIPKNLAAGLDSEWLRRAFSQAERAAPIGSAVLPAVSISHRYLIVDLERVNRNTVLPHSTRRRV